MKWFLCGLVALGVLVGGARDAIAQRTYVFTPIDPPGSPAGYNFDHNWGINDAGQIVGSYDFGFVTAGFLYSSGSYTTLPPLQLAYAEGINSSGQIVGSSGYSGFLVNGGTITPIQVPGVISTTPHGISDNGDIVGSYPLGGLDHAFLYSAGRFTTFDVPGIVGSTLAMGINNAGQIVGCARLERQEVGKASRQTGEILGVYREVSTTGHPPPTAPRGQTVEAAGAELVEPSEGLRHRGEMPGRGRTTTSQRLSEAGCLADRHKKANVRGWVYL